MLMVPNNAHINKNLHPLHWQTEVFVVRYVSTCLLLTKTWCPLDS